MNQTTYTLEWTYKTIYGQYVSDRIQKDTKEECYRILEELIMRNDVRELTDVWLTTFEKII